MAIPEADIKDLENLAAMGVELPFYAMTPRQRRAFEEKESANNCRC